MFYKLVLTTYLQSKTATECAKKLKITVGKLRYIIADIRSQLDSESAEKIPYLPM